MRYRRTLRDGCGDVLPPGGEHIVTGGTRVRLVKSPGEGVVFKLVSDGSGQVSSGAPVVGEISERRTVGVAQEVAHVPVEAERRSDLLDHPGAQCRIHALALRDGQVWVDVGELELWAGR